MIDKVLGFDQPAPIRRRGNQATPEKFFHFYI